MTTPWMPEVGDVVEFLPHPNTASSADGLIGRVKDVDVAGYVSCDVEYNPNGWHSSEINSAVYLDGRPCMAPVRPVPKFANLGEAIVWMEEGTA